MRHDRFADPAEAEAGQRDAELRGRQVAVEMLRHPDGQAEPPVLLARHRIDLSCDSRILTKANSVATKKAFASDQQKDGPPWAGNEAMFRQTFSLALDQAPNDGEAFFPQIDFPALRSHRLIVKTYGYCL
jgi:hypothetical protein